MGPNLTSSFIKNASRANTRHNLNILKISCSCLCALSVLFLTLLFFYPDPENLHSIHSWPGHYDLFWWADPDPYSDPQRWIWTTDRSGFYFCWAAAAAGNGRNRERPPQRDLPRVWRYWSLDSSKTLIHIINFCIILIVLLVTVLLKKNMLKY